MYIVETNSQLDNFLDVYNKYDSIILPIWVDSELHPLNNKLSLLFVRIIPKKEEKKTQVGRETFSLERLL